MFWLPVCLLLFSNRQPQTCWMLVDFILGSSLFNIAFSRSSPNPKHAPYSTFFRRAESNQTTATSTTLHCQLLTIAPSRARLLFLLTRPYRRRRRRRLRRRPPPTFLLGFVQASFFPSVKHKMPSGERYVCPYCSRKSAKSPGAACTRKSCLQLRVHASSPPSRPLGRRK